MVDYSLGHNLANRLRVCVAQGCEIVGCGLPADPKSDILLFATGLTSSQTTQS